MSSAGSEIEVISLGITMLIKLGYNNISPLKLSYTARELVKNPKA